MTTRRACDDVRRGVRPASELLSLHPHPHLPPSPSVPTPTCSTMGPTKASHSSSRSSKLSTSCSSEGLRIGRGTRGEERSGG